MLFRSGCWFLGGDYGGNPGIGKASDGNLYKYGRFGDAKHEYDADIGSGLYCDGSHSEPVRRNARRRRYRNAYVDINRNDDLPSCTHRLWSGLSDEERAVPGRAKREYLHITSGFLGIGGDHHGLFLQKRKMERESDMISIETV